MKVLKTTAIALTTLALGIHTAMAQDLKIKNYIAAPEHFGVTSTLIEGDKDAILVNAQFSKSEALRIAADILDSGKNLKTIFVSYGDPGFYFALDVFKTYFPNAQIVATPETVKHIQSTYKLKMDYWGPQMGANAPSNIIVPEAYTSKTLKLEDSNIEIKGKNELTYLWIPQVKAVVGGIPVTSGSHLWMADSATKQDRDTVVSTLKDIKKLNPEIVVPAHTSVNAPQNLAAVNFSLNYLAQYEKAVKATKNSAELTEQMKQKYPELAGDSNLELGAKVVKGEIKWP
ncbi:MBL fold metallo-hydrolase [Acinetobacter portensis]|uniref:MBL fold metallo-hydrolase n=1 Tax=Acinetobacter portensis TaxID=1839785 RepID=UPI0013D631A5|nr:MBL fold metallo-hydrolase [Acinetobacter portensis]